MKEELYKALNMVKSYCAKTDCKDCCIEEPCKSFDEHSPDGWKLEDKDQ